MGILSDVDIHAILNRSDVPEDRRVEVSPAPDSQQIGQCSIDLRLASEFARFRTIPRLLDFRTFDPSRSSTNKTSQDRWYKYYKISSDKGLKLRPGETVIASTREWVRLPKTLAGLITGRSSYSRMGLEVQLTQDLRQPGHSGKVLLQIRNNAPFAIRLYPDMRIAQLILVRLETGCSVGYDQSPNSKYKGEVDGISSKWFGDAELEGRPFISREPYLKALLDVLLIVFGVLSLIVVLRPTVGGFGLAPIALWVTTGLIVFARLALLSKR